MIQITMHVLFLEMLQQIIANLDYHTREGFVPNLEMLWHLFSK